MPLEPSWAFQSACEKSQKWLTKKASRVSPRLERFIAPPKGYNQIQSRMLSPGLNTLFSKPLPHEDETEPQLNRSHRFSISMRNDGIFPSAPPPSFKTYRREQGHMSAECKDVRQIKLDIVDIVNKEHLGYGIMLDTQNLDYVTKQIPNDEKNKTENKKLRFVDSPPLASKSMRRKAIKDSIANKTPIAPSVINSYNNSGLISGYNTTQVSHLTEYPPHVEIYC